MLVVLDVPRELNCLSKRGCGAKLTFRQGNINSALPVMLPRDEFRAEPLMENIVKVFDFIGERDGIRTHDLLIKSQMLYQLSYALPGLVAAPNRIGRAGQ